ncbi:MAG: DUF3500 domain-containing protein, partial [Actinobacteria bacterium]|nr:DUF3500 domain-containing protein [Actinomycetota bacterium]
MRRRIGGAMTASMLLLAACGGESDTADGSSTTTAAADAAAATEAASTATESTTASTTASDGAGSTATTAATVAEGDATPAIVAAANAFLDTLTEEERSAVLFDFSDTEQRQQWSNLPEGLYERDGLMWGDLDEDSQQAWLGVLQAILSDDGYTQVMGEWQADQALLESGGSGGNLVFGEDYYWVAIIGQPSETEAWQFQFGGHHVTVNATIKGADVSVTPSFIGAQPATYDADGTEVRPLGTIESDAYA